MDHQGTRPTYGVDGSLRTPIGAFVLKSIKSTYEVDGSPRIPTGALVLKSVKSYLRGGWITKNTNGCLGLKIYQVQPTRWTNHQGTRPTYGVDGSPRTPIGALVLKSIKSTYVVDGSPRIPMGALV